MCMSDGKGVKNNYNYRLLEAFENQIKQTI